MLYLHRQVWLQRQREGKALGAQPSLLQKSSPVDEESQPQKKLQAFKGGMPQRFWTSVWVPKCSNGQKDAVQKQCSWYTGWLWEQRWRWWWSCVQLRLWQWYPVYSKRWGVALQWLYDTSWCTQLDQISQHPLRWQHSWLLLLWYGWGTTLVDWIYLVR